MSKEGNKLRLTRRKVRRAFGLSRWEWFRFRVSRSERSYRRARREVERDRSDLLERLRAANPPADPGGER